MLDAGLVILPLLLQAAAAPIAFAPPLGTPFRYRTTETRSESGKERTFTAERRVVFRRDAAGFVAEVTLDRTDQTARGGIGAMFEAAFGTLKGKTIRFHLDRTGAVIAVDDRDALWDALCASIAAMGDDARRARQAKAVSAALHALPPDRRATMLGSIVTPLVADPKTVPVPGSDAPVSIRTRPPTGAPATIDGRQHVTRGADGMLLVEVRAEGDITTVPPGGTPGAAPGSTQATHMRVTRSKRIDPATGLILASSEGTRSEVPPGPGAVVIEAVTTTTLTLLVS